MAARLRGIELFQSCFQAVDGPVAVRGSKREAPSPAGIRLIRPHRMMRKATNRPLKNPPVWPLRPAPSCTQATRRRPCRRPAETTLWEIKEVRATPRLVSVEDAIEVPHLLFSSPRLAVQHVDESEHDR